MKKLWTLAVLVALGGVAHAENIQVQVDGMVCSFCAQGITKKFQAEPGVEKVEVNLDKQLVIIQTAAGQTLSDKQIAAAVDYAGYTLVKINRLTGGESK